MIFNQGPEWKCCNFAWIAALYILNPKLDLTRLLEQTKTAPNLLTSWRAIKWFSERWYASKMQHVTNIQLKGLFSRKVPVIAKLNGINWDVTKRPPYICELEERTGSHVFIMVSEKDGLIKCQNSYGQSWWDKGYFYLPRALFNNLQDVCQIIV